MWRIQSGQVFKLTPSHHRPLRHIFFQQLSEANMTVTNVIEVVVGLALLYAAYRFYQKRA